MVKWIPIETVNDEDVRKALGKSLFALNGSGYYAKFREYDIYIVEGGNGFIINIHPHPYIISIIKRRLPLNKPILKSEIEEERKRIDQEEFLKKLEGFEGNIIGEVVPAKPSHSVDIYSVVELKNYEERESIMKKEMDKLDKVFVDSYMKEQ